MRLAKILLSVMILFYSSTLTIAKNILDEISYENQNVILLEKHGFEILYSTEAKIPVIALYELSPEKTVGCQKRSNIFKADVDIVDPKQRSYPYDFSKSGYDLGHNVNAEDMAWSKESSDDSFLMSNMSPQLPGFNRGGFKKLETLVRDYVFESGHTVEIFVGNIWSPNPNKTLRDSVVVPDSMFKIIVDEDDGDVVAYIMPNSVMQKDLSGYIKPLVDIEKATGISFNLLKNKPVKDFLYGNEKDRQMTKKSACDIK